MKLSEQLDSALAFAPPDDEGLIVRVVRLDNASRPAQEAQGVLPVMVMGHEGLDQASWRRWIRENAASAYGLSAAERFAQQGIDLREMDPTRAFGRALRSSGGWRSESRNHWSLNRGLYVLAMVEKWPSLYNLIATEMAEEDMTLREFINRVSQLPTPLELGEGRFTTLGDIIGRNVVLTPSY